MAVDADYCCVWSTDGPVGGIPFKAVGVVLLGAIQRQRLRPSTICVVFSCSARQMSYILVPAAVLTRLGLGGWSWFVRFQTMATFGPQLQDQVYYTSTDAGARGRGKGLKSGRVHHRVYHFGLKYKERWYMNMNI